MPRPLAPSLAALQRQGFVGELEGLDARNGLVGWATALEPAEPLSLPLTLEDLLDAGSRWKLAELSANRPRADLKAQGIEADCGFVFLGHSGRDLPPRTSGMVVRAFFDAERRIELPGSPLRLDAERYQLLRQLCRTGLGRKASIAGLQGSQLLGSSSRRSTSKKARTTMPLVRGGNSRPEWPRKAKPQGAGTPWA